MGPFKEIALSCLLKINYLLKSSTDLNSKFSSDPMQIPGLYLGICPDCGLNGAGCRLWPFTMLCCWWDRSCIAKVIIKNYLRITHTIISAWHACTFWIVSACSFKMLKCRYFHPTSSCTGQKDYLKNFFGWKFSLVQEHFCL